MRIGEEIVSTLYYGCLKQDKIFICFSGLETNTSELAI